MLVAIVYHIYLAWWPRSNYPTIITFENASTENVDNIGHLGALLH
jgi:hypothetical protein